MPLRPTDEDVALFMVIITGGKPFDKYLGRLFAWAERRAERGGCNIDPALGEVDFATWPLGARLVNWFADRLDDLGLWVAKLRAANRLRKAV